ncbi:MAG: BatA domain-containing protein [Pirellulales bacterium]
MPFVPLPLAFGFTNLAMLGWLAAAAAPLIIHLWMRHTHREMPWAAIRFLQAAIRKHARRLQFQQWLLLAIRTAILALIVLAAAKPFWTNWGEGAAGARTHRLLIFDTSFSMGYRDDERTRFERSQQLARELIEASHPGDVYTLCTLSSPPQVLIGRAVADHSRVGDAIAKLELTQGTADLSATLRTVNDLLARVDGEARGIHRHEVVFLSDLGSNTWAAAGLTPAVADAGEADVETPAGARSLLQQIATRARLSAIDVGNANAPNVAVADIQLPCESLTTAAPTTIAGVIRNYSNRAVDDLVAELVIDGLPVAEASVDVASGGSAVARFAYQFADAGPKAIEVRLAEDRLPVDDRRYLAVDVENRARVLCVAGAPGAARYVAEALNPGQLDSAPVQPRIISESAFSEVPMEDFDCVFFCNVAQFSQNERDRINRYLQRGGGVVWFLGDRVLPEQYNSILGNESLPRPAGGNPARIQRRKPLVQLVSYAQGAEAMPPEPVAVLPALLGPIVTTPSYGLDPLGYRHPIVEPFRGRERAGLLTTPVSRYYRLEIPDGGNTETALATLNGDPFIVTAPVHRGRVVLVATAASLDSVDATTGEPWTAMPAWPSFLPLVREMFHYSSAAFRREAGGLVGDVITDLIAARTQGQLEVRRPDQRKTTLDAEVSPEGNRWSYASADVAGIYEIVPTDSDRPLEKFAVNIDVRESDLTRAEVSSLPPELNVRTVVEESSVVVAELGTDSRLHRILLTAVLALLLMETLLAWRFGRGAA